MRVSAAADRFYRVFVIGPVILAAILLQACGDGVQPEPQATPDEAVEVAAGAAYDVRRWLDHDNAWATLSDVTHFDPLDNDWEDLAAEGLVTTDSSGEAELCEDGEVIGGTNECNPDACHIFVYGDSDFGRHWCPTSGYTDCTGSATLTFEDCHTTVATLSADVTGLDTWFSVTYLWNTQVTLVVVGEGSVKVTPIRKLTIEGDPPPMTELPPLERAEAWADAQVTERKPGETVPPVRVDANTETARYLYTAPDEVLDELGLPQIVPDRAWLGMETLPLLRGRLEILEPRLEPWLERLWLQSEMDDIRLGPWLPVSGLTVITIGEPWEDVAVVDAFLFGVDWQKTMEILDKPEQAVSVYRRQPSGPPDLLQANAKELPYDPEKSIALLEEAGYAELPVAILSSGDEQMLALADQMVKTLGSAGFYAITDQIQAGNEQEAIQAFQDEGFAVVLLNREAR